MANVLPQEKKVAEYEEMIDKLQNRPVDGEEQFFNAREIAKLQKKLVELKRKVYSKLTAWERVIICRHPQRPKSSNYLENICTDFEELCGDRNYRNDPAIIGGLATIGGIKFVVIAQEKGKDTESRVKRNFGMSNPEGFRKALRLAKLAEKFRLPVLTFIDTPGAFPGLKAEERGQGWAIAQNLRDFSRLQTPVIVTIIGEGCSGGALGIGIGDSIGMLEHAYYSVISPEGCASILWRDSSESARAAEALKINAENMLTFKIIDSIIEEPLGGAHLAPEDAYGNVKKFILNQWESLKLMPPEELLERRYQKFRSMGEFSEGILI
ncbi:MAG: acetyl-CoA carboxylase carboxyltransferase subunit alpha [Chlamydiota bacterium]